MRKIVYWLTIILALLSITGCGATYVSGNIKESYSPEYININKGEDNALIKVAEDLYIWKVDDKELVGSAKRAFLIAAQAALGVLMIDISAPDSLVVKEGKHTIFIMKKGRGYHLSIQNMPFEKEHEYLINFIERKNGESFRIYYWMEDLTENKVVYGKKKTKEEWMSEVQETG